MSDNVVKLVPNLDKLTSRIVLNHRDPQQLRAIMEGICADYGLGVLLESKRPVCRSRPQDLPAAEPAPVGSNPLGAGRRWLGQLQVN